VAFLSAISSHAPSAAEIRRIEDWFQARTKAKAVRVVVQSSSKDSHRGR